MVSAILTCATLITISVSLGYLDFNQVFIPSTYIWPYLVGGVLFGLGMVMSGWCPGTAVVGFATGKIDAAVFLLGVLFGMSVYFVMFDSLANFANSSDNFFCPSLSKSLRVLPKLSISNWIRA